MSYEVRDNWGRKVGTITPSDSGCLGSGFVLILIVIALFIGLIIGAINALKPSLPPLWHVEILSDNAQHSGNFDTYYLDNKEVWNQLEAGASLTFTNIVPPKAGIYTLNLDSTDGAGAIGWTNAKEDYTLNVFVNGKIQASFHLVEDGPSTQPVDIHLQNGNNTIQVKLEGHDDTDPPYHTSVPVSEIILDQKTP